MRNSVILLAVVLLLLAAGCGLIESGNDPAQPPAAAMLPTLAGYNTVEGETLTGYINTAAGGAALLAGQPQLAAAAAAVDEVIGCYQEVGAVRARVYSREGAPLTAGAVAIADRNAVLSPANFFRCVTLQRAPTGGSEAAGYEPCTASYTLEEADNTFYILYAGTTPEICQAFCSQLTGCTAHP